MGSPLIFHIPFIAGPNLTGWDMDKDVDFFIFWGGKFVGFLEEQYFVFLTPIYYPMQVWLTALQEGFTWLEELA